jgi:hypothetical protein
VTKRSSVQQQRLEELESEFKPLLLSCLEECAQGRWGLFGQNDHADPDHRYSRWPEADHLKEIAREIQSLRTEFGQPNPLCARLMHYCSLRGSNVPGEPKLAKAFLNEMSSD